MFRLCTHAFDCVSLGDGGSRLLHDVTADCRSTHHIIVQAYAGTMIAVVGLGVPGFILSRIYAIRKRGLLTDDRTADSWGSLYQAEARRLFTPHLSVISSVSSFTTQLNATHVPYTFDSHLFASRRG